jgi:diaminopimelate epimerase
MLPFRKYHGLGNDYLVIHPDDLQRAALHINNLFPEWVRWLCDRHRGIGSDGLLVGPVEINQETLGVYIFNPDGSQAEKSGNGLRIFAHDLVRHGHVDKTKPFYVQTIADRVRIRWVRREQITTPHLLGMDPSLEIFEIEMGYPHWVHEDFPLKNKNAQSCEVMNYDLDLGANKHCLISCVSVGNPHCVHLCSTSQELEEIHEYGPILERHSFFPNRTNVQWAWIENRQHLHLRIWERGAGYTQASGSSSCAATSVLVKMGLLDHQVHVHMPGGMLEVSIDPQTSLINMKGPTQFIYAGAIG